MGSARKAGLAEASGAAFPGGAGARLLFAAGQLEAGQIEIDTLVASRIEHEVKGQAVGFVEMEGGCTGQHGSVVPCIFANPLNSGIQLLRSQGKSSSETLFFCADNLGDTAGALYQFRVGTSHLVTHGIDHPVHERIFLAQHPSMTDAPAQDLA